MLLLWNVYDKNGGKNDDMMDIFFIMDIIL